MSEETITIDLTNCLQDLIIPNVEVIIYFEGMEFRGEKGIEELKRFEWIISKNNFRNRLFN